MKRRWIALLAIAILLMPYTAQAADIFWWIRGDARNLMIAGGGPLDGGDNEEAPPEDTGENDGEEGGDDSPPDE